MPPDHTKVYYALVLILVKEIEIRGGKKQTQTLRGNVCDPRWHSPSRGATLNKPVADAECLCLGKRRILPGLSNLSLSLATDIRCWSNHYSMVSATPSHNGF